MKKYISNPEPAQRSVRKNLMLAFSENPEKVVENLRIALGSFGRQESIEMLESVLKVPNNILPRDSFAFGQIKEMYGKLTEGREMPVYVLK